MRHFSCSYREFEENPWKGKRLVWDGVERPKNTVGEGKEDEKKLEEQTPTELDELKKHVDEKFINSFMKIEEHFVSLKDQLGKAKDKATISHLRSQIKTNENQIGTLSKQMGGRLKSATGERKEALSKMLEKADSLKMAAMKERGANKFEYLTMFTSPSFKEVVSDLKSLSTNLSFANAMALFTKYSTKVGTVLAYFGEQTMNYVSSAWGKAKEMVAGEKGEEEEKEEKKNEEESSRKADKKVESQNKIPEKREMVSSVVTKNGKGFEIRINGKKDPIQFEIKKEDQGRPISFIQSGKDIQVTSNGKVIGKVSLDPETYAVSLDREESEESSKYMILFKEGESSTSIEIKLSSEIKSLKETEISLFDGRNVQLKKNKNISQLFSEYGGEKWIKKPSILFKQFKDKSGEKGVGVYMNEYGRNPQKRIGKIAIDRYTGELSVSVEAEFKEKVSFGKDDNGKIEVSSITSKDVWKDNIEVAKQRLKIIPDIEERFPNAHIKFESDKTKNENYLTITNPAKRPQTMRIAKIETKNGKPVISKLSKNQTERHPIEEEFLFSINKYGSIEVSVLDKMKLSNEKKITVGNQEYNLMNSDRYEFKRDDQESPSWDRAIKIIDKKSRKDIGYFHLDKDGNPIESQSTFVLFVKRGNETKVKVIENYDIKTNGYDNDGNVKMSVTAEKPNAELYEKQTNLEFSLKGIKKGEYEMKRMPKKNGVDRYVFETSEGNSNVLYEVSMYRHSSGSNVLSVKKFSLSNNGELLGSHDFPVFDGEKIDITNLNY